MGGSRTLENSPGIFVPQKLGGITIIPGKIMRRGDVMAGIVSVGVDLMVWSY